MNWKGWKQRKRRTRSLYTLNHLFSKYQFSLPFSCLLIFFLASLLISWDLNLKIALFSLKKRKKNFQKEKEKKLKGFFLSIYCFFRLPLYCRLFCVLLFLDHSLEGASLCSKRQICGKKKKKKNCFKVPKS